MSFPESDQVSLDPVVIGLVEAKYYVEFISGNQDEVQKSESDIVTGNACCTKCALM